VPFDYQKKQSNRCTCAEVIFVCYWCNLNLKIGQPRKLAVLVNKKELHVQLEDNIFVFSRRPGTHLDFWVWIGIPCLRDTTKSSVPALPGVFSCSTSPITFPCTQKKVKYLCITRSKQNEKKKKHKEQAYVELENKKFVPKHSFDYLLCHVNVNNDV